MGHNSPEQASLEQASEGRGRSNRWLWKPCFQACEGGALSKEVHAPALLTHGLMPTMHTPDTSKEKVCKIPETSLWNRVGSLITGGR